MFCPVASHTNCGLGCEVPASMFTPLAPFLRNLTRVLFGLGVWYDVLNRSGLAWAAHQTYGEIVCAMTTVIA